MLQHCQPVLHILEVGMDPPLPLGLPQLGGTMVIGVGPHVGVLRTRPPLGHHHPLLTNHNINQEEASFINKLHFMT